MVDKTKPYTLIPVWMTDLHPRSQNYEKARTFVVKYHEVDQTLAVADRVREMTLKKTF